MVKAAKDNAVQIDWASKMAEESAWKKQRIVKYNLWQKKNIFYKRITIMCKNFTERS